MIVVLFQNGAFCTCGDSYGSHGSADDCNTLCSGDPTRTCGAENRNSVYEMSE